MFKDLTSMQEVLECYAHLCQHKDKNVSCLLTDMAANRLNELFRQQAKEDVVNDRLRRLSMQEGE